MRCTQPPDDDGATEVVTLRVGVAVVEDDRGVVDALRGIRETEDAEVPSEADDAVPTPCVLPFEEHPASTKPETAQALTARMN